MATLKIYLLGGLRIYRGTETVNFPTQKTRSLFCYLVTYRNLSHSRDKLAGIFWGESPEEKAKKNLRNTLWRLRRIIGPQLLISEENQVQFNTPGDYWLDVEEFEKLVNGETGRLVDWSRALRDAVALYQGDFLEGFYDEWCLYERERLRGLFLGALERLMAYHGRRGQYQEAIAYGQRILSYDPLREEIHRELMRLFLASGKRSAAFRQYEICRHVLAEELDIEPMEETNVLYQEIRAGEPESRGREVEIAFPPPYIPSPKPRTPFEDFGHVPLVGREEEIEDLWGVVEAALAGRGRMVMVSGEAGVGKTRLVQDLVRRALWQGVRALWGQCYEFESPLPYQPIIEAMRSSLPQMSKKQLSRIPALWRIEVARLVPEIAIGLPDLPADIPLPPEQERNRLFEGITQFFLGLSRMFPLLLVLDSLHWADQATLQVLRYLCPRLVDERMLIVTTVRSEEMGEELRRLRQYLRRDGTLSEILLERLSATGVVLLIREMLGIKADQGERLGMHIYRESEGNPLFTIELAKSLFEERILYLDEKGEWDIDWSRLARGDTILPPTVREVIQGRLERLGKASHETLALASVVGRHFDFDLLLKASGKGEEEVLEATDDLLRRQLILEEKEEYQFAHDKTRQVVYQGISEHRRRFLHRRVGEALEVLCPTKTEELAHHYYLGRDWDKALEYQVKAGERAEEIYANEEALRYYERALELSTEPEMRFDVLFSREDVLELLGRREEQKKDVEEMLRIARQVEDEHRLSEALFRQSRLCIMLDDYLNARKAVEEALAIKRRLHDLDGEGGCYQTLGLIRWFLGDFPRALEDFQRALAVHQETGNKEAQTRSLNCIGATYQDLGDYELALENYKRSLAISREIGDKSKEGATLNNIGTLYDVMGDYARALEYYKQALPIHKEIGEKQGEGICLINIGLINTYWGDYEQALENFERSLKIFREVGDRSSEGETLASIGVAYGHIGDYNRALERLRQSLDTFKEIGFKLGQATTLNRMGVIYRLSGKHEKAYESLTMSLSLSREMEHEQTEGENLSEIGQLCIDQGNHKKALAYLEEAYQKRSNLGDKAGMIEDLSYQARAHLGSGKVSQALRCSNAAMEMLAIGREGVVPLGLSKSAEVYFNHYLVLAAAGRREAEEYLEKAYRVVMEQAEKIGDEGLRANFLKKGMSNDIIQECGNLGSVPRNS